MPPRPWVVGLGPALRWAFGPRRARVAKGAGRPVSEVNRLLDQFKQMQQMMKKVAKGGRPPMMPGMFR